MYVLTIFIHYIYYFNKYIILLGLKKKKRVVGHPKKKRRGFALTKGVALDKSKKEEYNEKYYILSKNSPPTSHTDGTTQFTHEDKQLTMKTRSQTRQKGEIIMSCSFRSPDKNSNPNIFHEPAGNRILAYPSLHHGITTKLVCRLCAEKHEKKFLVRFGKLVKDIMSKGKEIPDMMRLTNYFLRNKTRKTLDKHVVVKEATTGIETSLSCFCKHHDELFSTHTDKTIFSEAKPSCTKSTNFFLNMRLVMALQSIGGEGQRQKGSFPSSASPFIIIWVKNLPCT